MRGEPPIFPRLAEVRPRQSVAHRRPDRFGEWLEAPAPGRSADPRFEVRRALPSEFERIYDLIDETFKVKRPRALYEWLYRRNPRGLARCWVVVERSSGNLVHTSAEWPWPMARGSEFLDGVQRGDWAVTPRWQRQGLAGLRGEVKKSHPWINTTLSISWPNEAMRGSDRKYGIDWRVMGPITRQTVWFGTKGQLTERGWLAPLANVASVASDAFFEGWRRMRLGGGAGVSIEEVRRFDAAFEAVTERCMMWKGFWCPHDAEFLNWRYLEHPTRAYHAFAALEGDEIGGYSVVQIDGERGWLMDFVAPTEPPYVARALLRQAIRVARDAGCASFHFFAVSKWRHHRLFANAGFLTRPSRLFFETDGPYSADIHRLDNWQVVPGDTDFL